MNEQWEIEMRQSGTHIVKDINNIAPYCYIYGDDRYNVCKDVKKFLNEGIEPEWLKNATFETDTHFVAPGGIMITATGPYYDADPPNLNWREREDEKEERKALINRFRIN